LGLSGGSSSSPRASVVIPNWNGLRHLPECLETLSAQTCKDFEVVVVDNASTDGSVDWLRTHYPQARVVQRPDNGGFAKAVNAGIIVSKAEYVVLLNNDTAADPRWLESLVRALDERPEYDLAASMMILYDRPELLNAAGDLYRVRGLEAFNRGCGRPVSEFERTERVLGACAGAAIYRRSLFDKVGLFDEDFILVYEDVDLCLRCLIAGKRCLYVPDARIRHKVGGSRDGWPTWTMEQLHYRNRGLVAAKDLPVRLLVRGLAGRYGSTLRQTFPLRPRNWHLIPGLWAHARPRLAAEFEGLRLGWSKRSAVWDLRAIGRAEICRWIREGSGPV
jgi:GT2 family glycosyltransferase